MPCLNNNSAIKMQLSGKDEHVTITLKGGSMKLVKEHHHYDGTFFVRYSNILSHHLMNFHIHA